MLVCEAAKKQKCGTIVTANCPEYSPYPATPICPKGSVMTKCNKGCCCSSKNPVTTESPTTTARTCGSDEEYNDCGPVDNCEATCRNPTLTGIACPDVCIPKCVCKPGYVRDPTRKCVAQDTCPVVEGLKLIKIFCAFTESSNLNQMFVVKTKNTTLVVQAAVIQLATVQPSKTEFVQLFVASAASASEATSEVQKANASNNQSASLSVQSMSITLDAELLQNVSQLARVQIGPKFLVLKFVLQAVFAMKATSKRTENVFQLPSVRNVSVFKNNKVV